MPPTKDFQRRIEILDDCLRRRQKKWSAEALLEEVNQKLQEQYGKNISTRTLYGDLKYLQYDLDAPIEKEHDGRLVYYRYADPNFSIKNIPIRHDEVELLKDAIEVIRQVSGFGIMEDLEAVVRKLENRVTTNIPQRSTIIQFERNQLALGTEWLDDLFEAVKEKTVLQVSYQPFHKEAKQLVIHPYLLKEYRNRWFLIGQVEGQDALTTLALDRIRKVKPSQKAFREREGFDPDTYYDNMVGVTLPDGATPEKVTILVKKELAPYLKTKPLHPTQRTIKELANGSIRFTLEVVNNYELRAMLLGMGPQLKVEQPQTLVNQMAEMYAAGSALYSS